jgi:hypothetical protein
VDIELVERSLYFEKPGEDVAEAFRKHVAETGQPETFPTISTAKPPAETAVEVILDEVTINPKLRPNRDLAPCAICSQSAPKFQYDGKLIWCEASKAIYCIGPDCAETLWQDRRMTTALNIYQRAAREKAEREWLVTVMGALPTFLDWIEAQHALAVRADQEREALTKRALPWMQAASRALKLPDANRPMIVGDAFLRGTWGLVKALDGARDMFRTYGGVTDVAAWIAPLPASAVHERAESLRRALAILKTVHERLQTCCAFFARSNLEAVVSWCRSPSAPIYCHAHLSALGIEIRVNGSNDTWRARADFPPPAPVPQVIGTDGRTRTTVAASAEAR